MIVVGSKFAYSKIEDISEVVVVLPCVPDTAIDSLKFINNESICDLL